MTTTTYINSRTEAHQEIGRQARKMVGILITADELASTVAQTVRVLYSLDSVYLGSKTFKLTAQGRDQEAARNYCLMSDNQLRGL